MSEGLQAFLFRSMAVNRSLGVEEEPDVSATQETIDSFSADAREQAAAMGRVYELLYCLENSIRELIESTLKEDLGVQDWWVRGISEPIRKGADKRAADDAKLGGTDRAAIRSLPMWTFRSTATSSSVSGRCSSRSSVIKLG